MTIEIEPAALEEIKEQAKNWLDYEAQIHERVLKEKRWDVIDVQECNTMREVAWGRLPIESWRPCIRKSTTG